MGPVLHAAGAPTWEHYAEIEDISSPGHPPEPVGFGWSEEKRLASSTTATIPGLVPGPIEPKTTHGLVHLIPLKGSSAIPAAMQKRPVEALIVEVNWTMMLGGLNLWVKLQVDKHSMLLSGKREDVTAAAMTQFNHPPAPAFPYESCVPSLHIH